LQSLVGYSIAFLRNPCLIPCFIEKNYSKVSEGIIEAIVFHINEEDRRGRNTRQINVMKQLNLNLLRNRSKNAVWIERTCWMANGERITFVPNFRLNAIKG